ncbi:2703_t:CDS:2, partial [Diversispora eburnea]
HKKVTSPSKNMAIMSTLRPIFKPRLSLRDGNSIFLIVKTPEELGNFTRVKFMSLQSKRTGTKLLGKVIFERDGLLEQFTSTYFTLYLNLTR